MSMRTWLVTGGAGFIGSHLCDALSARGDRVRVLDDLSTGRRENLQDLHATSIDALPSSVAMPWFQRSAATVQPISKCQDFCIGLAREAALPRR